MKKTFQLCNKVFTILGIAMIVFIVATIFYQGVVRYAFGRTIRWVEEIASYLLVGIVFAGIGIVEQDDGHVKMDLMYTVFPNAKKFFQLTSRFCTFLFVAPCIYCEIIYLPSVRGKTLGASGLPLGLFHWFMLFGLIYWLLSILYSSYEITQTKECLQ
ncbi:hypothetical protein AGMMS50276_00670 [Synergistales bacterium]|nr:hypothetical protein AGMMS50276_00670 [Synergistales bacterium]